MITRPYLCRIACAASTLLALLAASPASAADLGVAPIYRAPAPVVNWTGSYIGISGGSWGNNVVHNDLTGIDQTPRSGIGASTTGYNFQNGNLVYGYESDTSATSRRGSAFDFPTNSAFSNEVKDPWQSTYRGRIGYAQNNWLLYATGGAALAGVDVNPFGAPGQISDKHWHWGWTVGGGVEMRLTSDWTAKVEYLFVGLQDKSNLSPAPSAPFTSNQRVSADDHVVRFGVNYKLPWSVLDSFFKK